MKTCLFMFLSDSNLSFSAWAGTKDEAEKLIRQHSPEVGRLVYLGAQ